MDLEFHQVDLRYEALRTRNAAREARLLASLAETGQLFKRVNAQKAIQRVFDVVTAGNPSPPDPDTARIHPWLLVAVNGFLALVAIAALIGIWFGRTGE